MATANGLMSTPVTWSSAFCTRTRTPMSGCSCSQRVSNRPNAPSRKWPEPQVGSISEVSSRAYSASDGSSVRSRMNSSTNSGVWSSAYRLRASTDRSW